MAKLGFGRRTPAFSRSHILSSFIILVWVIALSPAAALAAGDEIDVQQHGDRLAAISSTSGDATANFAPDVTARPQAFTATKPPRLSVYVVKRGQSLAQIAELVGVDAATIVRVNGLSKRTRIHPGLALLIPGKAAGRANGAADLEGTSFIASITGQRCWLFQDGNLTGNWRCSTGRKKSPTAPGSYRIQSKINPAYASTWDFWMPYWMGIYYAGKIENGIHGLPYDPKTGRRTWKGLVGTPITYGCIMLSDANAKTLFKVATVGMRVIVLP